MPTVRRMFVDPQIFPYYNLKPIPFIRRNAWESSRQMNELPGASLIGSITVLSRISSNMEVW